MELNENADLDPSQVEDMRGSRGTGGGGFQLPTPGGGAGGQMGGGGGGGGLRIPGLGAKGGIGIVVVVLLCLAGFLCTGQGGLGSLGNVGGLGGLTGNDPQTADNTQINESCDRSNPDRFKNSACVNLAFINSIQAYWQRALPENFGVPYQTGDHPLLLRPGQHRLRGRPTPGSGRSTAPATTTSTST